MKNNIQILLSEAATYSQTDQKQNTSLLNPFKGLFLPFIPSAGSFIITIVGFYEKPVGELKINVEILYKNKTIYTTGETILNTNYKEADQKANIGINLDVRNIPFPEEGEYFVKCHFNDEIYNHNFFVFKSKEAL